MDSIDLKPCEHYLRIRADMLRLIRNFFYEKDYLEVETPTRGFSSIPEAHIDPLESEGGVLYASPEIFMKPLLSRGFDRIFQIARVFRKGERGTKHLPEFTLLEWYAKGADYTDLMVFLEAMIPFVNQGLGRGSILTYQGKALDLSPPWDRLSVRDAFDRFGSLSLDQALSLDQFDEIMGFEIEPQLGVHKPLFLYDYPASHGSLARLNARDSTVAERVELYISGLELANGFSELTDSHEQMRRFENECSLRRSLGKTTYPLPMVFLESLETIDSAAGMAFGMDRLAMLFCDTACIDDVVAVVV